MLKVFPRALWMYKGKEKEKYVHNYSCKQYIQEDIKVEYDFLYPLMRN